MSTLDIAIIALAALVAIGIASRMASRGRAAAEADPAPAPAAPPAGAAGGADLVAVIAAAIAAESGMAPGSFRVAGISPAGGSSSVGGFNTPPWGFVDRMSRQARN